MASAKHQVLTTLELLESILLHLPPQTLLISAQRVNNTFHTTILSSPALQQKLFFQSHPFKPTPKHEFNPILQERFYRWVPDEPAESAGLGLGCTWGCLPPPIDWNAGHYYEACEEGTEHRAKMAGVEKRKREAYARKEASWRRMLPIQPAYTVFEVVREVRSEVGKTKSVGQVEFDDGVRLGTLYDYSQKTVLDPKASFDVEWVHASLQEGSESRKGKVRMYVWSSNLPDTVVSDSENSEDDDHHDCRAENLNRHAGRDISGFLYRSLAFEELDVKFKVLNHHFNRKGSAMLTEWIVANSTWKPRLGR